MIPEINIRRPVNKIMLREGGSYALRKKICEMSSPSEMNSLWAFTHTLDRRQAEDPNYLKNFYKILYNIHQRL